MSDALRERIREDLRGNFRGELLFDPVARSLHSTDASLFQIEPLAVAFPADETDVRAIVRLSSEHHISLVPRGAGTGLAGESLGPGIVVDLSVYFRRILEIGDSTVRVQPGVVLRHLNAELEKVGRRFAPDPASGGVCTVGGMIATNASGSRSFRFGYTRDHVEGLRVVWDDGSADDIGIEPRVVADEVMPWNDSPPDLPDRSSHSRTRAIVRGVADLLETHRDAIERIRPRTPYNRLGYTLDGVLTRDTLDLPRLLVGSEGTLAMFTEATLRTIPLAGGRAVVLLAFADIDSALAAAELARDRLAVASELMDQRLLSLARTHAADELRFIPSSAETLLIVEFENDTPAAARASALDLIAAARTLPTPPMFTLAATEPGEIASIWRLRESVLPGLYAFGRGPRPLAFIEDIGLPVEELPRFVTQTQDLLQRFETTASFLIHALTGQIHIRPFLDLSNPADAAKLWPLAQRVYEKVLSLGGTVSTQHGTGLARTPWVAEQCGPLAGVFRDVKAVFDPLDVFNPGKIVGPDPSRPSWPMRPLPEPPRVELRLQWQPDEFADEVARCNGCGDCRIESPRLRMCPIFRATGGEAATPRAKANLLRQSLTAPDAPFPLTHDAARDVADLCVNCRMCATECSAGVNIPKLMIEAKAAHQSEHGLERSDWVLARMEHFAAFSSHFALVVNAMLGNKPVRWVLEKFFGVSRSRRLPAFAEHHFMRQAKRFGWTKKAPRHPHVGPTLEEQLETMMRDAELRVTGLEGEFDRRRRSPTARRVEPQQTNKIAYFADMFANYNDPSIGVATVKVLRHHGFEVHVPPRQKGCGMSPYARGDIETAREVAVHNTRLLAGLVREGYRIVCSEPTAALMLRHDYLDILDDPDAHLVAANTVELTTMLDELRQAGRLRTDFERLEISLGHHVPCHLKALRGPIAGPGLLSLIPGVRSFTIDVSCSGMAGTFGFNAGNYATSLEAGRPMLDEMNRPRVLFGATECSACRTQMEEGSGKRTLHPVQYLALAYGLMPELARRLRQPLRPLISE